MKIRYIELKNIIKNRDLKDFCNFVLNNVEISSQKIFDFTIIESDWAEPLFVLNENIHLPKSLLLSVKYNRVNISEKLLSLGVNANWNSGKILLECIKHDCYDCWNLLIKYGGNYYIKDNLCLIEAVNYNAQKILNFLLNDKKINIDCRDGEALYLAVEKRNYELLKIIMLKNPKNLKNAFLGSIVCNNQVAMEDLLKIDSKLVNIENGYALNTACKFKFENLVLSLLSNNADLTLVRNLEDLEYLRNFRDNEILRNRILEIRNYESRFKIGL